MTFLKKKKNYLFRDADAHFYKEIEKEKIEVSRTTKKELFCGFLNHLLFLKDESLLEVRCQNDAFTMRVSTN